MNSRNAVYGCSVQEADGTVGLYDAPFDRPTAIIGSEGTGAQPPDPRQECDYIVSIPMRGRVNSLNASNAAAVLLFEALPDAHTGQLRGSEHG